jgi:hypothetical protein
VISYTTGEQMSNAVLPITSDYKPDYSYSRLRTYRTASRALRITLAFINRILSTLISGILSIWGQKTPVSRNKTYRLYIYIHTKQIKIYLISPREYHFGVIVIYCLFLNHSEQLITKALTYDKTNKTHFRLTEVVSAR